MQPYGWITTNKSTLFVIVGMLAILGTVAQLQSAQLEMSHAASDVVVGDEGSLWFDVASGTTSMQRDVRVQLAATKSPVTYARLALDYSPEDIASVEILEGPAFSLVESSILNGKIIATSKGSFFGSGNWMTVRFTLAPQVETTTVSVDARSSQIQYEDTSSVTIGVQNLDLR